LDTFIASTNPNKVAQAKDMSAYVM
jgi:hypothetical protein